MPDSQDPGIYLPASIRRSNFTPLPITLEHTYGVLSLAKHHADPFDRLLIWLNEPMHRLSTRTAAIVRPNSAG